MYEIANDVEIDGTVEQVWQVLSGFDHFDAWNPVIRSVAGTLTVGQNVVISVAATTGLRDADVEVVRVDAGREFAWTFSERLAIPRAAHFPGRNHRLPPDPLPRPRDL